MKSTIDRTSVSVNAAMMLRGRNVCAGSSHRAILSLLLAVLPAAVAQAQWTVTNLHPAAEVVGTPPTLITYTSSRAVAVRNGRQVGSADYTASTTLNVGDLRGKKWAGSAASAQSLPFPPNDTDGVQQVATVFRNQCSPVPCPSSQALLFGDNSAVTVLGEGGFLSFAAEGVDGTQQVGSAGSSRAALWTGTAASLVSLDPSVPNITSSVAMDVRAGHQVGYITVSSSTRACQWTGTAASYVDLHPPAATSSRAFGLDNGVQVGDVFLPGTSPQAAMWRGTAASYVNLHPVGASRSVASGAAGEFQAGTVWTEESRATIWRGTAASAQDLHAFLPAGFSNSTAEDIDVQGSVISVVGYGVNTATNREEALLWSATMSQITQPPVSVIACSGTPAVFSIGVVQGSSAVTYRWRRNSVNLVDNARVSGSQTPTLTISGVDASDVGSYDCIVTDSFVTLDSVNASLTIAQATANRTPNNRVCPGGTATVSLNASLPPGPTSHQWRRNGVAINSALNPSAVTAVLNLPAVVTADAGTYDCLVTTSCGVIDSSDIAVIVGNVQQPPTDQAGCIGGSVSFTVLLDQDRPGKQWLKNGIAITGNPTATTATLVLSGLSASDVATYSFRYSAGSSCGTITTGGAALTLSSGAPSISQQPADVRACGGNAASFTVAANGAATYSWRKNSVPISAATNPSASTGTLTIANAQAGDAGSYDCIVTSTCGSVTSASATLTYAATCGCSPADLAGAGETGLSPDGTVDGTDFIAFINSFAIGDAAVDPLADIAGAGDDGLAPDGTIDGSDFIAFINAFAVGC